MKTVRSVGTLIHDVKQVRKDEQICSNSEVLSSKDNVLGSKEMEEIVGRIDRSVLTWMEREKGDRKSVDIPSVLGLIR